MRNIIKILCVLSVLFLSVSIAGASINSEMNRYDSANEKQFALMENSFKCQYNQFAGHENIIVISMSANFENSNCVRAYTVLPGARLRLTDYKGRTETVTVKELQKKYEVLMMAKAPESFDTTGNLSSNSNTIVI